MGANLAARAVPDPGAQHRSRILLQRAALDILRRPLIAGTLIVALAGFGNAATIVGVFFIIGAIAAPFLPETKGKPLPHALWLETPTPSAIPAPQR